MILKRVAVAVAGLVVVGTAGSVWAQAPAPVREQISSTPNSPLTTAPRLTFGNRLVQGTLGVAYQDALKNLLVTNTVPDKEATYNKSGLLSSPPGTFVRAGGGYDNPWTRDASINSWNAASLLEPAVARNTLWAVCEKLPDGKLIVQRDNQWWDKVIWVTSAWNHYLVTGDRAFLTSAYEAAQQSLSETRAQHYNAGYGLFGGPAFFSDGIAGYPEPEFNPANNSSFVLDHRYVREMMALSTNCVYYNAFKCAGEMADELGRPASEVKGYANQANALKKAINQHLWQPQRGTYAYFVHGAGPLKGQLDTTQEGIGLAYAVLFGVASPAQAESVLTKAHHQPYGLTTQWPHFPRYDDAHPGRHNVITWPLVNGMWACAAAQGGRVALFADEVENLALLEQKSDRNFYEIYNSLTGVPDGGWQSGHSWDSQPEQTWSATAYLRMIYSGLFGLNFETKGVRFAPTLPPNWSTAQLEGLKYRNATLDITLRGSGQRITSFIVDGVERRGAFLPADLTGSHRVVVTLAQRNR